MTLKVLSDKLLYDKPDAVHLHKAWCSQIKQTPTQAAAAAAAREYRQGRSMFKSASLREHVDVLEMHI